MSVEACCVRYVAKSTKFAACADDLARIADTGRQDWIREARDAKRQADDEFVDALYELQNVVRAEIAKVEKSQVVA